MARPTLRLQEEDTTTDERAWSRRQLGCGQRWMPTRDWPCAHGAFSCSARDAAGPGPRSGRCLVGKGRATTVRCQPHMTFFPCAPCYYRSHLEGGTGRPSRRGPWRPKGPRGLAGGALQKWRTCRVASPEAPSYSCQSGSCRSRARHPGVPQSATVSRVRVRPHCWVTGPRRVRPVRLAFFIKLTFWDASMRTAKAWSASNVFLLVGVLMLRRGSLHPLRAPLMRLPVARERQISDGAVTGKRNRLPPGSRPTHAGRGGL